MPFLSAFLGVSPSMARNCTFKFLSWNVRGLNGRDKCTTVKAFIKGFKCGAICLQETKLSSISSSKFHSFCGFHIRDFRTLDTAGTRGGIITCATLKGAFFQELRDIGARAIGAWALVGDFNLLLSFRDKNSPPSSVSDILFFRNVISDFGLFDLPIYNRSFSWTNGRPNPTLERLDRALVSRDWHFLFSRSTLRALPRPRSDHTPLLLTAFSFVPASHLFRFEAFWLRH